MDRVKIRGPRGSQRAGGKECYFLFQLNALALKIKEQGNRAVEIEISLSTEYAALENDRIPESKTMQTL